MVKNIIELIIIVCENYMNYNDRVLYVFEYELFKLSSLSRAFREIFKILRAFIESQNFISYFLFVDSLTLETLEIRCYFSIEKRCNISPISNNFILKLIETIQNTYLRQNLLFRSANFASVHRN